MSDTMYTALSGAVAEERNLEIVANNLANINTPGFKGERLSFRELLTQQDGNSGQPHVQVEVNKYHNDMTQGVIKKTGEPLDLALRGPGFFVVQSPDKELLTRQGSFIHAADSYLRNQSGHALMGDNGPISAPITLPLTVDKNGNVFSNGIYVDTVQRMHVHDEENLQRQGNSLWNFDNATKTELVGTPIEVGALEQSNVNAVQVMTQLINTQRHYEMYHKAMENNRSLQQKIANQLG